MNRFRIMLVGFVVVVVALIGAVILGTAQSGTYESLIQSSSTTSGESTLGLEVRLVDIEPDTGLLQLLAVPRASGQSGRNLSNGAFFTAPVVFNLDVARGESSVSVAGSSVQGAIPAAVSLLGSDVNYPFDRYQSSLFASASVATAQERPIFILNDVPQVLPGFNIRADQVSFLSGSQTTQAIREDQRAGYGFLQWEIQRSSSTIFIAGLIAVIMVSGAVISLAITWAIARRRRPPSIAVMVWLAVFLFALFQVRGQLPGDPPAGVAFDRFIFFPVVLTLVLLVAVNLIAWSTREDWDLENPGSGSPVTPVRATK